MKLFPLASIFILFTGQIYAKSLAECKQQHKTAVQSCQARIAKSVENSNTAAEGIKQTCGTSVNVCNAQSSALQKQTAADLAQQISDCESKDKKVCADQCAPDGSEQKSETQPMKKEKKKCEDEIADAEKKASKGSKEASEAAPKTKDVADKNGAEKPKPQASNSSPPPAVSPAPASPQTDTPEEPKKDEPPPPAAATPAAPATPAPAEKEKGSAGFKTASTSTIAAACAGAGASYVVGCPQSVGAPATAVASPFPSTGGAAGGSAGATSGGGGGGINAAQVAAALAGGVKNGESEKDGKSTGIHAASLNMATDGGGGGGAGSGPSMGDLDFGFKSPSARGPAAALGKPTIPISTAGGSDMKVAAQKMNVTKIVSDVYIDRCKAGRFLHCGNNK